MKIGISFACAMILMAFLLPTRALGYIGPGLGGSGLATVIGSVMGLGMFLAGSVLYPIKLAIRKVKKSLGIR